MSTKPMRIAYLYQRFSSEQQKGNSSLFRQTEAQDAWLANNPDVVVQEKLVDQGLSGFKGDHLKKGSLGKLVSQIEAGLIPKGSLILVEHFSRLTRQSIDRAEELLRTIWNAGITIITVRCCTEYPPESINNMATRIKLIVEIESAYKDSKFRSDKAKAVHAKKRIEAAKGITPKIRKPFWLDKGGKLNEFAPAVYDMFELYLSGLGQVCILRELQDKYPNFKPILKMSPPTVIRCITNEIARGHWLGNKVYEPVVDDKIFFEAQHIQKNRLYENVKADRKWPLSGLVQCGYCDKGMSIQQTKGSLPLLRCSNRQRIGNRSGCKNPTTFPYALADHFFNRYVLGKLLNQLTNVENHEKSNTELQMLETQLSIENKKHTRLKAKLEKADVIDEKFDFLIDLIGESRQIINKLKREIDEIEAKMKMEKSGEISQDIFTLAKDDKKLNIALHKIGFKLTLYDKTLSYGTDCLLTYLNYCRKKKHYLYQTDSHYGFLPSKDLTVDMLLNKSGTSNNNDLDRLTQNYSALVEKLNTGEKVQAQDIFSQLIAPKNNSFNAA